MEVRKNRPRGFKKEAQGVQVSPLNALCVSPWRTPIMGGWLTERFQTKGSMGAGLRSAHRTGLARITTKIAQGWPKSQRKSHRVGPNHNGNCTGLAQIVGEH
jgi:hypothetical protein